MKNELMKKISILLISIFLLSHLAIAPAIPKLYALYNASNPDLGLASVETLVTIPAMMITIFVLLGNFVIAYIGKKKTVMLGLILILISGVVSFFTTTYSVVFICRLLLGIGIGLYNSLSISIISDFYEGNERSSMIGYRTAFLNIGKAFTTFIVGYAIIIGANYAFLTYVLVLPVFILFAIYVPDTEDYKSTPLKQNFTFNKTCILTMLTTFLVGISYIGATIKIPSLLVFHHKMPELTSSYILTILALSGTITGFIFGFLIKYLGDKTLLLIAVLMGLGNFIFIVVTNEIILYIAAVLIGASFVGIMSFVFYYISKTCKHEHINFVTSLSLVAGNIGVIITPLILTKFVEKIGLDLYVTPFYITTLFSVFLIGLYFVINNQGKKVE